MQKKIVRRPFTPHASLFPDLHPVLTRVYSARGVTPPQLALSLENLLGYETLTDIKKAVLNLYEALIHQKKILIVGDFDADGATSTALAIRALKSFGAKEVDFLVPNRFTLGYGLTPELVAIAKQHFDPDLIITVDNGIANHAGVQSAKTLGIKVIITDHHLSADTLPPADAIVNPNQPNDLFPSKNIAGVGVIFYVMLALRRYLCEQNWFKENNMVTPQMAPLLDLVALGTVADVVPLDYNNRILVHQGLGRIRAKHCVPGILALFKITQKNIEKITAQDLGFVVAPRLNAAGRLQDMSLGIECLLTDDMDRASDIAQKLDLLNQERREIEHQMQEQAFYFLKKCQPRTTELPRGLCLFDEEWHQGVIGILASRIKDKYHRPVIAFASANESELKGSARSIPSVHIRDVLAFIDCQHPHLIQKFGGHAMAAGLVIAKDAFADFSIIFDEAITREVKEEDLKQVMTTDGQLLSEELNLTLAELLRAAGPWGQAFPEPLFDGVFQLLDQRLVGEKHLKMVLKIEALTLDAIAFNIDLAEWPNYRSQYVKIAYKMDVNEYKGWKKVQLLVEHLEAVG